MHVTARGLGKFVGTQFHPIVFGSHNVITIRGIAARWAIAAVLFLPISGCAVGPNFVPPAAPISDKFREANSRSVKSTYEDYRDWWKVFHDPILNRLIQTAYNQNLTLLSAGTRVLQARAALGIAIGVSYPQVQQGTGSLINNRSSAATPLAGPIGDTGLLLD